MLMLDISNYSFIYFFPVVEQPLYDFTVAIKQNNLSIGKPEEKSDMITPGAV